MKKEYKTPKWKIEIGLIVAVLFLVIIIDVNYNKDKNKDLNDSNIQYEYKSNNILNTEFKYEDIEIAELANYQKYSDSQAKEHIMNQKVYVKISSIEDTIDEGTATSKKWALIAFDQDGNKWKLEVDNIENIKKYTNSKVYGLYKGLDEIDSKQIPVINVYTYHTDLDYIDRVKYKEISRTLIDKLNQKYSKENFSFSNFDEGPGYIDVTYKNKLKDIKISVYIDSEKEIIKEMYINFDNHNIKFTDIDEEFLKALIMSFDSKLSDLDAANLLVNAKAYAYTHSTTEQLTLNDGIPITSGIYNYKDNKLTLLMSLKIIYIEKTNF